MTPLDNPSFFSRQQTTIKDNPLSPNGRFGRLSFIAWYGFLNFIISCSSIAMSLTMGVFNLHTQTLDAHFLDALTGMAGLGLLILAILYIYFNIVIVTRRFHDMNKSGWWMLLLLIPLINIALFFYLLLGAGTAGHNQYGPQRFSAIWEKVLAWTMILITLLSLFASGSMISYMVGSGQIEAPTDVVQKGAEYF